MSEYFEPIVQKLLETTDRQDAAQANLRAAAYEALMEMVKNSPKDCYITVQKTTMVILERLQQVKSKSDNLLLISFIFTKLVSSFSLVGFEYGNSREFPIRSRSVQ